MILDLFIYIIQFYINQNTFLPGFIIRKRVEKTTLKIKSPFLLPYWNYNSGEMDEIKIIIAKRLHYALKIEEYRA